MKYSFVTETGEVFNIDKSIIIEYPYETYLFNLLYLSDQRDKFHIDRDEYGNIRILEHSKYFSYVVNILHNKITSIKDLLINYANCVTPNYVPDIFYNDKYNKILEMLDYYGFNTFKCNCINKSISLNDLNAIKINIDKYLSILYTELRSTIIENNIYISGSFPLFGVLSYLGIDTTENDKRDIDMYISYVDLFRMINYKIEKNIFDIYDSYKNKDNIDSLASRIKNELSLRLQCQLNNFHIIDINGKDNQYGLARGIITCFRFNIGMHSFDLVVTEYNPKGTICNFDFDFNKVYYDGLSLVLIKPESIQNMSSNNNYALNNWSLKEEDKFHLNINRIKKYIDRGFYISVSY